MNHKRLIIIARTSNPRHDGYSLDDLNLAKLIVEYSNSEFYVLKSTNGIPRGKINPVRLMVEILNIVCMSEDPTHESRIVEQDLFNLLK